MEIKEFNNNKLLVPSSITSISNLTINPYKGCSFGCKYCYAALNKNVRKYGKWGTFVIIKNNIKNLLEKEINNFFKNSNNNFTNNRKNYCKNNIHKIIIGSNTDPYQPVELKYRSTQTIIKILNKYKIGIFLMTKSPLITRDLNLISKNPLAEICFTINSSNIINRLENSYSLDERIETIYNLFKNNIDVYIHIGPYIPYFTDLEELSSSLKKYFINCKKQIKLNIEPLNLLNANPEFLIALKQIDKSRLNKLKLLYTNKNKYLHFYSDLEKKALSLFSNKFIKRVKILKREFNIYYSNDINLK